MTTTFNLSFKAEMDQWATAEKDRLLKVAQESTQRLTSIISNKVPVDTGFARASVRASLEEMPDIDPDAKGGKHGSYPLDMGSISVVLANLKLGQTAFIGWTASYAEVLEYGHSKQAPQGFVRIGVAQWPQIVEQVIEEAKALAA
jgi:hypothetical protein